MVERILSMDEVLGSIPGASNNFLSIFRNRILAINSDPSSIDINDGRVNTFFFKEIVCRDQWIDQLQNVCGRSEDYRTVLFLLAQAENNKCALEST